MNFLQSLNNTQREAVTYKNGPLMVIAGPGSGKTRVLTFRIAHLIQEGVDPFNILALTFTNKSAREMKERITHIVGSEGRNIWMGTFHSVFARILRFEADKLGYPKSFTIYDTTDAKSLLKSIIKEEGLSDKLYKPAFVYNRISLAKNNLIGPIAYSKHPELISDDECSGRPKIAEIYTKYAKRCFQAGAMDFDDLLYKTYQLFKTKPEVLYKYQHQFRHVLIDEFQDTNYVQYLIVKKLSDVFQNLCVVGDDAQSIYGFRGADIKNMLLFQKAYPELKTVKLEQNYRSTKQIVQIANQVISQNKGQLAKKIWTNNELGEKINLIQAHSDNDEARQVAEDILEKKLRHHYSNSDFSILYRTNAQSRAFEEWLRKLNITYRIYGGLSFYQRKEIKDFLSYLRLIVNPNDEEALKRVINVPTRGIGNTSVQKLIIAADKWDCGFWEVISKVQEVEGLSARAKNAISDFGILINSLRVLNKTENAYKMAMEVSRLSGINTFLFQDKSVEGISRYENLQELLNSIQEYVESRSDLLNEDGTPAGVDLSTYLQEVSLLSTLDENDDDDEKVSLMTIHSAKGLEFKSVYVAGLEEDLFPSALSLNDRFGLEEERRLFYVAVTRAEKHLALSCAQSRYRFGNLIHSKPSRFLKEIDSSCLNQTLKASKERSAEHAWADSIKWRKGNTKKLSPQKNEKPKRAISNRNQKPLLKKQIAPEIDLSNFKVSNPELIKSGMQVLHPKFGEGQVLNIDGQSSNRIANIHFPSSGDKKIMLKYAKLQILG